MWTKAIIIGILTIVLMVIWDKISSYATRTKPSITNDNDEQQATPTDDK
jgi:hypothetical protein